MSNLPVIFLAFANEREEESRYLRALAIEQRELKSVLEKAVDAGLCELVIEANATIDSILDTFQRARYQDRIAVFHYGGHADGFQLLLETATDHNEIAHGEGLVSFLGSQNSLQLIFLNGCVTHQQATGLTEKGVPAVIGTSNAINDKIATQLSVRFYAGLANGATIGRAWKEAQDEIKIKKGTGNVRGLYFRKEVKGEDRFPWELYLREGAEIVQEWNLPYAVDNPLFGLPDLPLTYNLPDQPYRFLERYFEEHAEIFFGRSYAIRDLYERTSSTQGAPITLFYGQSGVGKSSLLDAGLLPRLREDFEVVYARRNQQIGLGNTLREALHRIGGTTSGEDTQIRSYSGTQLKYEQEAARIEQMEALAAQMEGQGKEQILQVLATLKGQNGHSAAPESFAEPADFTSLLEQWKAIETQTERPLIVLLDQVEELFTRPWAEDQDELSAFLDEITGIFGRGDRRPKGKLILGYRKEYNPEIEEAFKSHKLPREKVFLKQLSKKDIVEVVHGLGRNDRLKKLYRLSVEPGLGELIADDLLVDKDSPIAPVLQILLTKMWLNVEADENRYFTIADYHELQKGGILMENFLEEQLEKCRQWRPDIVNSGLALDLLNYHTTSLGTAETHKLSDIRARYAHREDVLEALVSKLKELYLLTDAGTEMTGLAHDTLAPLVKQMIRNSDQPGHRALRIIQQKTPEYLKDHKNVIDQADLRIVEAGYMGMRMWSADEQELVKASQKKRVRAERFRRNLRRLAALAVLLILMGLGWALVERNAALTQKNEATKQAEIAQRARDNAEAQTEIAEREKENAECSEEEAIAAKEKEQDERERADSAKDAAILATNRLQKAFVELEAEKNRADDSTRAAQIQRDLAKAQKKEADSAKVLATVRKEKADTLRTLTLAKNLAIKSLGVEQDSIKGMLAMQAYTLNKDKKGDPFDPDIYRALYGALEAFDGAALNQTQAHDNNAQVRALVYTPKKKLFSTGSDGRFIEWKVSDAFSAPKASPPLSEFPQVNLTLASNKEGEWLAGTSWHVGQSGQPSLQEFPLSQSLASTSEIDAFRTGNAQALAFLPDENAIFFTTRTDDTLRYYNLGQRVLLAPAKIGAISRAMGVSPDGRWLVLATDEGEVLRYDLSTFALMKQLPTPQRIHPPSSKNAGKQYALAFSRIHNSRYKLACGVGNGENTEIHVFTIHQPTSEVETHEDFQGHLAPINQLAFHPAGELMASASQDGTARIWQSSAPLELPIALTYISQSNNRQAWVTAITFSPGGRELIAGYGDGMVKVWPVYSEDIVRHLCPDLQGKQLSKDDWERYGNTAPMDGYKCEE